MSKMMDLFAAAVAVGGTPLAADGAPLAEALGFGGVSTDSRAVAAGELFVALRGVHFDGHQFVTMAKARGAAAAMVDNDAFGRLKDAGLPLLVVADTRRALGALAADWRTRFSLPLIAVTGSNGKTTTKEMLASIMRTAFSGAVLSTHGNLNNDIGLPLTLLRLTAAHRAAIVEMGMNHPGEIATLARIARPTVAVVTNAQRAHLAGMGSIESIAREKGSVFTELGKDGVAVYGLDDPWAELWHAQSAACLRLNFSLTRPADVSGVYSAHGLDNRLAISAGGETVDVALAVPGAHTARNALAAASAAIAAGIPLAVVGTGLAAFRGIKGRLQRRSAANGAVLLDDTYNANPDSVRAGIDVLAATIGRKIVVLGDMGEIGDMSGQFHDEVGGYAKSQGVDLFLAFGEWSALAARNFGSGGRHFGTLKELVDALLGELTPETTVLVKGSRTMQMERVVQAITDAAPGDTGALQGGQ